jgi:hypothetical protein
MNIIGIDLGKTVFHLVGMRPDGSVTCEEASITSSTDRFHAQHTT